MDPKKKLFLFQVTIRDGEKLSVRGIVAKDFMAAVTAARIHFLEAGARPGSLNGEIVEAKHAGAIDLIVEV